ncbi:hypothetical protein RRG08_032847 [Elysia crispata]|uniref:Uncharacterized protein n=1 Tax=Elysia crispata TaxID=231223 RepID=A0AAE1DYX4_9GAST|nr:hypothetical protein RRG08_032847 [Elysia crispata]
MTEGRYNNETEKLKGVITQVIGESVITVIQGVLDEQVYVSVVDRLNQKYPGVGWAYYVGDYDKNNDDDVGERMGFFFRTDKVAFTDIGTWQEDNDKFHRAPIYAHFRCAECELKDFYLFGFHTWTLTALEEINELPAFYRNVSAHFNVENILFAGDMNAGYFVTPDQIDGSLPSSEPGFKWLIGNDVDSLTFSFVSASLQRFLACTEEVADGFEDQGQAVEVQQIYNLTQEEAAMISALKPVEVFLKVE